jgi:hypothetical protein
MIMLFLDIPGLPSASTRIMDDEGWERLGATAVIVFKWSGGKSDRNVP